MLTWLNQHIGTDWATYLGALLGLVALFSGYKVYKNRRKNQQSSGNAGNQIQIGGDFNVDRGDNSNINTNGGPLITQAGRDVNYGLNFESCERIFSLLMVENFPKLQEDVITKARNNMEILARETYKKLEERIDRIDLTRLTEPDVQSMLNDAIQGAAKKGAKANIELLAELISLRLEKGSSDFINICTEEAIKIVPRLTSEMLCVIASIQFIQHMYIKDPQSLEHLYDSINKEYLSKCGTVTIAKLRTIASLGAGNFINIMGGNTFQEFKKKYPAINVTDAEKAFPQMVNALRVYDMMQMYKLTLSAPGQVIGLNMIKKYVQIGNIEDLII